MAEYPALLDLTPDQESALKAHLDEIINIHAGERDAFIDDLIKQQRDYWAAPSTEEKTFPFKGAANLIIPLTAIAFETVHARTMTQLFGLRQTVSVSVVNPGAELLADPVEDYLDHEFKHTINVRKALESAIIELQKFGTGVASTDYVKKIKYGVRDVAGERQVFPVVVERGAKAHSVPLSRFLCPYTINDPKDAQWAGEEHSKTPYEIKVLENSGFFYKDTYETLRYFYENFDSGGQKFTTKQEELEKRKPFVWQERMGWYEFWLAFDYDESGEDKEIVVHYHHPARVLLAVRDNWNFDLRKKYITGVYIPVEHRLTGIGIAKQNEQFQREVTTQHRQRLDNATVVGMRMFKISKLSGYGPKEPIFPGKMWFLDDMDQIDSFQGGEIYPSSFNDETLTLQYSQQRTGVNDVTLGMPQSGTPGTATSDITRVQEGRKKFDYTYGNTRIFVSQIYNDLLLQIAQYGPSNANYFQHIKGGQLVAQFLQLPPDLIRDALILDITSAGERENDITDRQDWLQLSQIIQQYMGGMVQMAQLTGDQQLLSTVVTAGMRASTEALKQILDTFDKIKTPEKLIIMELLNVGQLPNGGGNQGAESAGANGGGMGGPPQIAATSGAGGPQGNAPV